MEREKLLREYEVTLESLVEKTKFVYSEDFYKLDDFDKQKYQKDKIATETHLSTLCNLLWGAKIQFGSVGLTDMFALGIISSMFGTSSFGSQSNVSEFLDKELKESETKEQENIFVTPTSEN